MRRIWMALMGIAIAATLATEPSVHRLVAQNPPTEEEDVCRRVESKCDRGGQCCSEVCEGPRNGQARCVAESDSQT